MIIGMCLHCKKEFRKRERLYKFCSLICSNRHNLNGLNKVQLPNRNKSLAEFIGICLGDGYAARHQTAITLNSIADAQYLPYVIKLIAELFPGATISIIPRKKEHATDVRINSRIVVDFLQKMGIVPNAKSVPSWILRNPDYTAACIKGLFDTEGSLSFKTYKAKKGISLYKQLNFRNTNTNLMSFVRDSLIVIGLKPIMTLKKSLHISNDKDIAIFRERIGFGNPKLSKRSLISDIIAYQQALQDES